MTTRALAWLVPFAYGLLLFLAGVAWLVTGAPFDKATYEQIAGESWQAMQADSSPAVLQVLSAIVRMQGGNSALLAGIMVMAVAATGLRSGERWAWYVCWILPLHAVIDLAVAAALGGLRPTVLVWDVGLTVAVAASLMACRPHAPRKLSQA